MFQPRNNSQTNSSSSSSSASSSNHSSPLTPKTLNQTSVGNESSKYRMFQHFNFLPTCICTRSIRCSRWCSWESFNEQRHGKTKKHVLEGWADKSSKKKQWTLKSMLVCSLTKTINLICKQNSQISHSFGNYSNGGGSVRFESWNSAMKGNHQRWITCVRHRQANHGRENYIAYPLKIGGWKKKNNPFTIGSFCWDIHSYISRFLLEGKL